MKIKNLLTNFKKKKQYMKYYEAEFECDNSWSINNIWSVFYVQNHDPTKLQINEVLNRKGINKIIRVIEVTEDDFYNNANDYVFDVPKETEDQIKQLLAKRRY